MCGFQTTVASNCSLRLKSKESKAVFMHCEIENTIVNYPHGSLVSYVIHFLCDVCIDNVSILHR